MESGTYVYVRFDGNTVSLLGRFMKENDIPNAVDLGMLHTTLIYSKIGVEQDVTEKFAPQLGLDLELSVWKNSENHANVLVIKYKSDFLMSRHNQLMKEYKFSYDHDLFIPHVTLSYDCGDVVRISSEITDYLDKIVITNECQEILQNRAEMAA